MTGQDLLDRRARSADAVGWGARVNWNQPRNACLWVFVATIAYGVWYTISQVRSQGPAYGTALSISALIFTVYAVLFWWFTTRIDRYSRQPVDLRVAAFVWGGFAATWAIALQGNTALLGLYSKLGSQQFAIDWGAGLAAPFMEELGKGSGVLLLLFIARRVIRTAFDGFVIGAFVGLGFEIIEDILYSLQAAPSNFGVDPVGSSIHIALLRLGTGFTSHILYSAIFGAGVVYLVGTVAQRRRIGRGLILCAIAMVLHGVWDSNGALAGGSAFIFVLLAGEIILAGIIVVIVYHVVVEPERSAMRDLMAPEAENGTITEEELTAVAGAWKQRRTFRRAGGVLDRRRRAHRLEAARDLADALGSAGGEETERTAFARAELARFEATSSAT
ncbi:protease PrsW [Nocardioides marmoriginsengisoli]|uniref:Protease PrsW n=1 Tax=Nocardioides marmoriginsengisoli TaxID=661483 RepID=A0A3N0CHA9_9ACTN|nr:PrsW family intramembrane metalloprotease [Nocardioides marmoriginsengisoli]RNL62416.1 protease PrsW [Nocardioides marmoriginsengisoli]